MAAALFGLQGSRRQYNGIERVENDRQVAPSLETTESGDQCTPFPTGEQSASAIGLPDRRYSLLNLPRPQLQATTLSAGGVNSNPLLRNSGILLLVGASHEEENTMCPRMVILCCCAALAVVLAQGGRAQQRTVQVRDGDWPMYRHDSSGSGHSPLAQIDTTLDTQRFAAFTHSEAFLA